MTAEPGPAVRGHFDGVAPDRSELRGWCLQAEQVWLRAGDSEPVAVACREARADLEALGWPLFCGFVLPLEALGRPEDLLGQRLWASLDAEGRHPLPEAHPWRLGAGLLLRSRRQALTTAGEQLLRQQGPAAAVEHFAEALLNDPDHGPFHGRLRYALYRLEEAADQSCGS
jgi:hypothetical protein